MEFRDINGNIVKLSKADKARVSWRPSVYGFLVKDGHMLCVKQRWTDSYSLPGGGMEFGEDISTSLKREFLEETGYDIGVTKKQPVYINTALFIGPVSKRAYQAIVFYYEVRLRSNKQKKAKDFGDGMEIKEIAWKKMADAKASDFLYFHRPFVKLILKK
jgi:8-oxo-dGTP pyrophosphatase MutT (NUDIX family)